MAFRLTPLRMSVSQPSMSLPLPSVGDHKGNAFPMMSSSSLSSSASSSSCCVGGEWSPEALDYHMLEVTVMTHHMDRMATDVVLSKWLPEEEESKAGDYDDDDDASVGKMQTALELTESNDNSVSVYLDANARAYHQEDTWDHNDNLTLGQSIDDLSSGSSEKNGRRPNCRINRGCSWTPDSDATEIPDDEDDEEEDKALFLSVSSDMDMLRRSSMALTRSCSQSTDIMSSGPSELLLEGPDCTFFGPPFESQTQPLASSKVLSEDTQISSSSSSPSSANVAENAKEVPSSKPDDANRKVIKANSSQPAGGAAKTRPTKTVVSTVLNTSGLEAKRVSKLDLRNVKAKVGSQCAQSPLKTPNKNKCAPAYGKRAVPRKEEAYSTVEAGGKKQRSSAASPVVLIPRIRGKSISHLQTNRKTAATAAAASEKRPISPTLRSASPRSVASEGGEDGNLLASTTKELQELSGTTEGVGDAHEECVQGGQREATAVEKQRNHSRKVSSKLGPNTRLQGRGTSRVEKRPSQPALNPGLGAGGAPRINYSDSSSTLGHAGQSESPAKGRQIQGQCQGIPKPRTAAERASSLASTGPARSKSKATANQQPASGGWPAAVPAASKLPVKGLPTSLSSLSLGSNENNGATSNAPTASAEEQPSRGTLPVGSRCTARTLVSSTAATTSTNTPRDTVSNAANTANTAAPKHPAMRSRALSLQARTTATGLKAPSVSSHNTARTATNHSPAKTATNAAGQGLMKLTTHNPLQRSGSARLSRLNSTVDRNKPREAGATHSPSSSCSPTGGSHQAQLLPPPEPVADVVDVTVSLTPVLPVPTTDTTSTPHTGASALGFKARTGSRSSLKAAASSRLHHASRGGPTGGGTNTQSKEKNQAISQLRKLLLQGNKRVEALATVIQHLFTQHEESLKQKKELALELANLRDELVCSTELGRLLQSQKQEGEQALTRLEQEHRDGLLQLEDRLRSFYQTEWDKVHQTYQDEADKCRMLMEQQVEELRSRQEAERQSQEVSHCQELECVKQQYEDAIQELKRIQQTDLENMQKTLKETETSLSDKVSSLLAEKESLHETVRAEEERRKGILNDKSLKDSHTVYLEQELDSLKVVLEIKNNQLHQKDKKLMEMEKMVETNVKLEECLKKVQQENEDYRARMDKHAALSRQLSTEQAKLQQTLQKESKVNKRLSMENEELLWKLHNGDLLGGGSPRRLSPTSPFGSPRNSASFPTSAPLSPR